MSKKYLDPMKTPLGAILLLLVLSARVQPAAAQESEQPDQNTKAMHYSLYYEEFKNANYEGALPNLRWVLANAPAFPQNDDRNFRRLLEAYDSLSSKATDPAVKRAWLDSALTIFDTAVPTLKDAGATVDEFEWTLDKGRFIQNHPDQLPELQENLAGIYEQAYQMAPERMSPYYLKILTQAYAQEDKQKAVDFMDEIEGRYADDQDLMDFITQYRNALFKSPEERMEFLETRRAKEPDNMEIINELFEIYRDLNMRDKMYEIGEELMSKEPTPATYRIMAKLRLDDGEPQEAVDLFQKAIDLPGAEPKVEDYYNMGIAMQQLGRLQNARTYFRKALEVDPKYGRAYIAIGDLYVTSVANCGSFEREDQAVYWLATDYYERARSADASVASAANQKINAYRKSYPDAEALFFKGWKAGQPYRVDYGCYQWIGESTTVKQP